MVVGTAAGAPLAGVRVVEAASYVSGPFATLALADLGAEVTKVEPPRGDPYRRFGPQDEAGGVMFRAINRNKTSVVLDLKAAEGVAALHELLDGADVLLSNWRPAVAASLGLDPLHVRERWPRLVWVRVSGYGQEGPLAEQPAFDSIMQARTAIVAARDGDPELLPMYIVDKVTAMTAVQAALAALVHRSVTGRGTIADVSMLESASYFNAPDITAGHQAAGASDPRIRRHLGVTRPLRTEDGAVVISPVSGKQLKRALEAVGSGEFATQLRTIADATAMAEAFYDEMASALPAATTGVWLERFAAADVPATAVFSVEEHIVDPQLRHAGFYRTVDEGDGRLVRRPRYPSLFDGVAVATADLPAPGIE